jgi:hypothetical protein
MRLQAMRLPDASDALLTDASRYRHARSSKFLSTRAPE